MRLAVGRAAAKKWFGPVVRVLGTAAAFSWIEP